MDAETFRWAAAGAFGLITALLAIIWRSASAQLELLQTTVRKIDKAVALDLRGLSFRISRVENHLNLPPLIHHISSMDEDTLG
jgi:hypothetical protein